MRKGNETEIIVTMRIPEQETLIHVPGILIAEGMTAGEIRNVMMDVSKFIIEVLVANGKMRYFPKEMKKLEGLSDLLEREDADFRLEGSGD